MWQCNGPHKARAKRVKINNAGEAPVDLNALVYARHGRELMGLKSLVSVPCNVVKRNTNY